MEKGSTDSKIPAHWKKYAEGGRSDKNVGEK